MHLISHFSGEHFYPLTRVPPLSEAGMENKIWVLGLSLNPMWVREGVGGDPPPYLLTPRLYSPFYYIYK